MFNGSWTVIWIGAASITVPGLIIALCWGARRADAALAAAPITVITLALLGLSGQWLGPVFTLRNAVGVLAGLALLGVIIRVVIAMVRRGIVRIRRRHARAAAGLDPVDGPAIGDEPTPAEPDRIGPITPHPARTSVWPGRLGRAVTAVRAWLTVGARPGLGEGLVGLALTTWIGGRVMLGATDHNLEIPMQSWDAPSHVNTIRHIAETGIADPTHAAAFTIGSSVAGFYPNEFRALGAALMWTQPIDAVVASNLAAVLVAGLVWPASIAIFARSVLGRRRPVTWLALTLSLGSTAMPWQQLGWGVLWPAATGAAIAPLVLACAVGVFGLQARRRPRRDNSLRWWQRRQWPPDRRWRWIGIALLAPTLAGAFLGHPRTLVLLLPAALIIAIVGLARAPFRLRWYGSPLLVIVVVVTGWLGYSQLVRAGTQYAKTKILYMGWGYTGSLRRSITDQLVALTDLTELGRHLELHNVWFAVLTLVGVLAAIVLPRGTRWLVVCWAAAIVVQAATTAPPTPGAAAIGDLDPSQALRLFIDGSARPVGLEPIIAWWYGDAHRSAALVPVFSTMLAVLGATVALEGIRAALEHGLLRRTSVRAALASIVVCALVVALGATQLRYSERAATDLLTTRYAHQANHADGYVSAREVVFMKEVGARVGRTDLVLNNPTDGSVFLYGLTGTRTVFVVSYLIEVVKGGRSLHDTMVTNPDRTAVCALVRKTGIRWVLNMGPTLRDDIISQAPAPGMQIPPHFWLTTPVLSDGHAALYRITGCPDLQ